MENTMTSVLHFESASLTLGGNSVLRPFSLDIRAPEYMGITGPSGAGKTCLLRMAAGLLNPSGGRVIRQGDMCIGFVSQHPSLLPWRRAWENIAIPLLDKGYTHSEAEKASLDILSKLCLAHAADYWAGALSGGMARRVSIARAIAIKPAILLLDEPFTGLDEEALNATQSLIMNHVETHRPLVLHVTHHPCELQDHATRLLLCRGGEVLDIHKERQHNERNSFRVEDKRHSRPSLGQSQPRDNARLLASGQPGEAGSPSRWNQAHENDARLSTHWK